MMSDFNDPHSHTFGPDTGHGLKRTEAYALVDAIAERDDLALTASAYEQKDGSWAIDATCDSEPDLALFHALAQQVLGGDMDFVAEPIDPEIDWVAKSQSGLTPVSAGGFFIHGSHDADQVPTGAKPIQIDAAQAFGTGHHATTSACLDAIDIVLKTSRPRHCIDVGTGSGVLAIALAKRLRHPVVATDIDPVAVKIARANAVKNQVGAYVNPFVAKGLQGANIAHEAPYDLVVANILAGPLLAIASDMAELTATHGHAILSGLLAEQAPRIIAAYHAVGFKLKRRLIREDWAALILSKR